MTIAKILSRVMADTRGTSAIEYGIICGMIVIGLIAAVDGFADENTGVWAVVSNKQQEATQNAIN